MGRVSSCTTQAVEFAVKRKFDIISMSWTIQKSDDAENSNAADLERLKTALERAVKDEIVIFCSAPDIGNVDDQTLSSHYPFGCKTLAGGIFRIGAAKADGTIYSWTGDPRTVDFILPGHNVELSKSDRIVEEDDIPKTGSSVATALAAGLAALIVHCVRLGAIYNFKRRKYNDSNVDEGTVRTIKRYTGMKEAFNAVCPQYARKHPADRNLEVENFFRNAGKLIGKESDITEEEKWIKITQLARDLVSSNTQLRVMKDLGSG